MKACLASPTVVIWTNPVIRYYRVAAHMLEKIWGGVSMTTNMNTNQSIWQNIHLKALKNLSTLPYLCFNVKKALLLFYLLSKEEGKKKKKEEMSWDSYWLSLPGFVFGCRECSKDPRWVGHLGCDLLENTTAVGSTSHPRAHSLSNPHGLSSWVHGSQTPFLGHH